MTLRKGFGAELALPHANDLRLDMAGMVVRNAAGVPRGGIFPPAATNLLSATASMNVAVAAFSGVAVRDGGVVFLANDGPVNVLLPNPPSSNSALHVVWAKQNDSSSYVTTPDADNNAVFGVLAGASAPIPVRNPAGLPAGAIELGTVLVPSTATNTGSSGVIFTPTYLYTAMAGGKVWFRNGTERDAFVGIDGQPGYVMAENGDYVSKGGAWKRASSGMVMIAPTVSGSGASVVGSTIALSQTVAGTIDITGLPSDFDHYRIEIVGTAGVAGSAMNLQLLVGGAPQGGTAYYQAYVVTLNGSAPVGGTFVALPQFQLSQGTGGPVDVESTTDLFNLTTALRTNMKGTSGVFVPASGVAGVFTVFGGHNVAVACDGVRISSTAPFVGKIYVFGYNK